MGLIVNMATSKESGEKVAQTLNQVTSQYLQKNLELLGVIESTPNVRKALLAQKPLLESYPNDPSATTVRSIAKRILQQQDKTIKLGDLNGDTLLTGLLDV
jgi:MinD-like ATPase involved in chromosome partitioning or flagellar assembly